MVSQLTATDTIVQGTALAAVLAAFGLMLRFLLKDFTRSLKRIDESQLVVTLTLVGLAKQLAAHDHMAMTRSMMGITDDEMMGAIKKSYDEMKAGFDQSAMQLTTMMKDRGLEP